MERPITLLGIPILEFGILVCLFLGLAVLGAITRFILPVPGWYEVVCLSVVGALYAVLRWAAGADRPQFLASWLSFHFAQPKRIEMDVEAVSFLREDKTELS